MKWCLFLSANGLTRWFQKLPGGSRAWVFGFLAACLPALATASEPPLLITLVERPPYYFEDNGVAKGYLLDIARTILQDAGISARFEIRPAKRGLIEIQEGSRPACGLGWIRDQERERFAKFTLPVFRHLPMIALTTPAQAERLRRFPTLRAASEDSTLRLAVIDGLSYGPYLDALLRRMGDHLQRVTLTGVGVMRLVVSGRVDYTLVDQEEMALLFRDGELDPKRFAVVSFHDIPPGHERAFMCSRSVSDDIVLRINAAIATRFPELAQ